MPLNKPQVLKTETFQILLSDIKTPKYSSFYRNAVGSKKNNVKHLKQGFLESCKITRKEKIRVKC